MTTAHEPREAAGQSTSVWLTAEEYEQLRAAAAQAGISQNSLIRIGLRRMLGLPRISSSRVEAILDDFAARPTS